MFEQNLVQQWHDEGHLSIVIVRHPLSRLASVYYQKFVELSTHKSWSKECLNKRGKIYFYCDVLYISS